MSSQTAVTPIRPDAPAEALTPEDASYHDFVLARANEIDALMQQQQQIATEIAGRQGAVLSWRAYVQQKYGLGDQDRVTVDHRIVRAGQDGV